MFKHCWPLKASLFNHDIPQLCWLIYLLWKALVVRLVLTHRHSAATAQVWLDVCRTLDELGDLQKCALAVGWAMNTQHLKTELEVQLCTLWKTNLEDPGGRKCAMYKNQWGAITLMADYLQEVGCNCSCSYYVNISVLVTGYHLWQPLRKLFWEALWQFVVQGVSLFKLRLSFLRFPFCVDVLLGCVYGYREYQGVQTLQGASPL